MIGIGIGITLSGVTAGGDDTAVQFVYDDADAGAASVQVTLNPDDTLTFVVSGTGDAALDGTHTTDAAGNSITAATLAAGPAVLVAEIEQASLTVGDTATYTYMVVADDIATETTVALEWFLDGVSASTSEDYVTDAAGDVTLQVTATQGANVTTYTTPAVTATAGARTIADVIADHGGDYFDFDDVTRMYTDAGVTNVATDGDDIAQVNGIAGNINLSAQSGSLSTWDQTAGGLDVGTGRALETPVTTIGPSITAVASVTFNDVTTGQWLSGHTMGGSDRAFGQRIISGTHRTAAWDDTDAGFWSTSSTSLTTATRHTLTSRVDAPTKTSMAEVDGTGRANNTTTNGIRTDSREIKIGWFNTDPVDGVIHRMVLIPTAALSDADILIVNAWAGA